MTLSPGTTLGPYAIVSQLGSGMGVVSLAHDPPLDRHVAINLLRLADSLNHTAAIRENAYRVDRLLAKLSIMKL